MPPNAYLTAEGDVLDEICWRRYGREDAVPAVLDANRR
ncbi:MAG: tail protein X, partial [Acidobacteria bacterium]|nr:tail protein X [Acidobacteriota bacterium]